MKYDRIVVKSLLYYSSFSIVICSLSLIHYIVVFTCKPAGEGVAGRDSESSEERGFGSNDSGKVRAGQ